MKQLDLMIRNHTGLHARPAKELVNVAKKFRSKITVQHGAKTVNAKSMMSLLTLGVRHNGAISVVIDGDDEVEAASVIEQAILSGLGEDVDTPVNGEAKTAAQPTKAKVAEEKVTESVEELTGLHGIPVCSGVVMGRIWRYERQTETITAAFQSVAADQAQLAAAIAQAQDDLQQLSIQAAAKLGANAEIFHAHSEILGDPDIKEAADQLIDQQTAAAHAWQQVMDGRAESMSQLDNALMAERAADVRDVRDRVLAILAGKTSDPWADMPAEPIILLADELLPSDTVTLDTSRVLAICTVSGSKTSHSAILARSLGIPAVMGIGEAAATMTTGTFSIVNGATGQITLDPTEDEKKAAQIEADTLRKRAEAAQAAAHDQARTSDGTRIEVVANIGSVADAEKAYANGAEGVGLCRTEFLFLDRETPPTIDEQTAIYRGILTAMNGNPVIFRTLDVGGDKPLSYLPLPPEENPFLGIRGIRLALEKPDLLRDQIHALLNAADAGPIRIMFPMVSDLSEWRMARAMVQKVQDELGVTNVECGIMIEVPSAALMADIFAAEVDFFSVGTNDLTQYTLAMDRLHPVLAKQSDGLHPAVLRLIAKTAQAAKAHGKWVGVCGELAADPQATTILIGLGVTELSVSGVAIAAVKANIRATAMTDAEKIAQTALGCATAKEVRASV